MTNAQPAGTRRWILAALTAAAMTSACGAGQDQFPAEENVPSDQLSSGITFEQFLKRTHFEPDSGVYVANGDETFQNIDELRDYYEQYIKGGQLTVRAKGGKDKIWSEAKKRNITYCVSTSFSRYAEVVKAMESATKAWEKAADVDFIYVPSEDANCNAKNANVVFDVNPVNDGAYLARAFFPDSPRSQRNLLIDGSAFGGNHPTLLGVVRHELGHTLGFRHEHCRPDSGACFEDDEWRAVTSYDPKSVMHYPQCNGTGDQTLTLTAMDKEGARAIYGAPRT